MQTATVATKPTASQMMAAKRAAKKSTQQERALKRAGAVKNVDRNRLSTLSKAQKENIAEMLSGVKVSEDEAVTRSVWQLCLANPKSLSQQGDGGLGKGCARHERRNCRNPDSRSRYGYRAIRNPERGGTDE